MDGTAAEKVNELREIVKEIAVHEAAISDLKKRMRVVLELEGSRLDPRKRLSREAKQRLFA
jgi:hypothetical protein